MAEDAVGLRGSGAEAAGSQYNFLDDLLVWCGGGEDGGEEMVRGDGERRWWEEMMRGGDECDGVVFASAER